MQLYTFYTTAYMYIINYKSLAQKYIAKAPFILLIRFF